MQVVAGRLIPNAADVRDARDNRARSARTAARMSGYAEPVSLQWSDDSDKVKYLYQDPTEVPYLSVLKRA